MGFNDRDTAEMIKTDNLPRRHGDTENKNKSGLLIDPGKIKKAGKDPAFDVLQIFFISFATFAPSR